MYQGFSISTRCYSVVCIEFYGVDGYWTAYPRWSGSVMRLLISIWTYCKKGIINIEPLENRRWPSQWLRYGSSLWLGCQWQKIIDLLTSYLFLSPSFTLDCSAVLWETFYCRITATFSRRVPKTYFWSTFFYTKLTGEDQSGNQQNYSFDNVSRWTKRYRKKAEVRECCRLISFCLVSFIL